MTILNSPSSGNRGDVEIMVDDFARKQWGVWELKSREILYALVGSDGQDA